MKSPMYAVFDEAVRTFEYCYTDEYDDTVWYAAKYENGSGPNETRLSQECLFSTPEEAIQARVEYLNQLLFSIAREIHRQVDLGTATSRELCILSATKIKP